MSEARLEAIAAQLQQVLNELREIKETAEHNRRTARTRLEEMGIHALRVIRGLETKLAIFEDRTKTRLDQIELEARLARKK